MSFSRILLACVAVPCVTEAASFAPFGQCGCTEYDDGTYEPAWSPDGNFIAFVTSNAYPPYYEIWASVYAMRVAPGIPETPFSYGESGYVHEPSWSPDGNRIVFSVGFGLRVLDASGETTFLATGDARHPSWSPDGSTIAFESQGNIWLLPVTGGTPTQITMNGGAAPAWSPDGTRVAYAAADSIWIVSASGGVPTKLTNGHDPAWSHDGKWIAFTRGDIWVIAATGGTAVQVTTDPALERDPTWAPDGKRIAYTRTDGPYCSCVWIASDLPDFTTQVSPVSWSKLKTLFRE